MPVQQRRGLDLAPSDDVLGTEGNALAEKDRGCLLCGIHLLFRRSEGEALHIGCDNRRIITETSGPRLFIPLRRAAQARFGVAKGSGKVVLRGYAGL